MTKHTKGPWIVETNAGNEFYVQSQAMEVDNFICEAEGIDNDTAYANARLIAAAPDMLEALEIAIEQGEFQPKVRDILVNTINKAKGVI